MLGFQNRDSNIKLLNFYTNRDNHLISKNAIFKGRAFVKYETVIRFVASKWVQKWSRILILSPGWSCKQNKTKSNWHFLTISLEKHDFLQTILNIDIFCTVGKYFSSWVWIRDRYVKIRLRLTRINW